LLRGFDPPSLKLRRTGFLRTGPAIASATAGARHQTSVEKLATGIKVESVEPGSIFSRLGIRQWEVLISLNGVPVKTLDEAQAVLNGLKKNTDYRMEVFLGNEISNRTFILH